MDIGMNILNPFDYEGLIEQMQEEHGFDLKKDLKAVNLTKESFSMFIQDLYLNFLAIPPKGDLVSASKKRKVYKTRHKDDNRNIGTSGAYRLLSMLDNDTGKVYPFHLYHKTSGKKPKTDLTPKEKEEIKKKVSES